MWICQDAIGGGRQLDDDDRGNEQTEMTGPVVAKKKNKTGLGLLTGLRLVFSNTDVLKTLRTKDALGVLATCRTMNGLQILESAFLHRSIAFASFDMWLGRHGDNINTISLRGNSTMDRIRNGCRKVVVVRDAVKALKALPHLMRLDLSAMQLSGSGKLLVQIPVQTERERAFDSFLHRELAR